MTDNQYPKKMTHPHFRKGATTEVKGFYPGTDRPFTDYQGTPDVFPPVSVENPDQESWHRARGYLMPGEAPPPPIDYSEYPLLLVHPEHVDAIPAESHARKLDNGVLETYVVPGHPEKFPAVQVDGPEEEKKWEAKGWHRPGRADPDAVQAAKASPYVAGRVIAEYPRYENGVLVDPSAGQDDAGRYPMYVGDVLVHSPEQEAAARGTAIPVAASAVVQAQTCIICGEPFGADQQISTGKAGPYHAAHLVSQEVKKTDRKASGRKSWETRQARAAERAQRAEG